MRERPRHLRTAINRTSYRFDRTEEAMAALVVGLRRLTLQIGYDGPPFQNVEAVAEALRRMHEEFDEWNSREC
jgi:hypothetical protein